MKKLHWIARIAFYYRRERGTETCIRTFSRPPDVEVQSQYTRALTSAGDSCSSPNWQERVLRQPRPRPSLGWLLGHALPRSPDDLHCACLKSATITSPQKSEVTFQDVELRRNVNKLHYNCFWMWKYAIKCPLRARNPKWVVVHYSKVDLEKGRNEDERSVPSDCKKQKTSNTFSFVFVMYPPGASIVRSTVSA